MNEFHFLGNCCSGEREKEWQQELAHISTHTHTVNCKPKKSTDRLCGLKSVLTSVS